jgi:hypothetical protein
MAFAALFQSTKVLEKNVILQKLSLAYNVKKKRGQGKSCIIVG